MPVSRLINYHPERIAACSFLAGGYAPPLALGSDRISQHKQIKQAVGYDVWAYMRFFVQPDAAAIIEEHVRRLHISEMPYSRTILILLIFSQDRLLHQSGLPRDDRAVERAPVR
jgi:hypothetical protein